MFSTYDFNLGPGRVSFDIYARFNFVVDNNKKKITSTMDVFVFIEISKQCALSM